MAQPNKPSKTMSSRLLTMKFMQRAAATPPSSPSTPPEPPSKKQRLSNGSYNSTPSTTPRSDAEAVEVALAAEEQRRTEALEKKAAEMGDTKWYLSFKESQSATAQSPLHIVPAGFSTLDASSIAKDGSLESGDDPSAITQIDGRRSFGKVNHTIDKQQNPDLSSSETNSGSEGSEDDDEGDEGSDDPTGAKALIVQSRKAAGDRARTERRVKRKADKADALRMAEERRKKQVKLNKLTSISGSGGAGSKLPTRPPNARDMTCFNCGKTGHMRRDCPQASQQRTKER